MIVAAAHIYRILQSASPEQKAYILAELIYKRVQTLGVRQARWYRGTLRTYPYPAIRGYGTRGELIGIYSVNTRLEWVLDDVLQVLSNPIGSES